MTLTIATAATGVARTAHYVIPTGQTQPIQTLLLEPQRTNLCIRSEEFDTWTDTAGCSVSANAGIAPDGTATADLLTAAATAADRSRPGTFTGDGTKCIAVFLKAGTSTRTVISLRDVTAAVSRHNVRVTWTAGVPTLSTDSGAGTLYPVEAYGNGWYRILFSVDSVVAANTNNLRVLPDSNLGTGNVLVWGYQAENAVVPSSYIPTAALTVTRNADSLYFPFTAPPQAMTVYVREVNRGNYAVDGLAKRYFHIGTDNIGDDPRFVLLGSSTGALNASYDDGVTPVTAVVASAVPARGAIVETRAVLNANWTVTAGLSVNGGAETTTTSTASGAAAAWAASRLYLCGLTSQNPLSALTHVVVATGEQSLATMRQLAGVA